MCAVSNGVSIDAIFPSTQESRSIVDCTKPIGYVLVGVFQHGGKSNPFLSFIDSPFRLRSAVFNRNGESLKLRKTEPNRKG